ncbi:hypothetical protein KOAAANKH_03298 [Brevundimonas sp. NIBR10]|uniref:MAPEG family protein n=1 Tax=Brevundimonas sp. NIBR10 TaxID=3015997 RepID=UPI0022F1B42F|nr:MAPEG family protein [Brevundimonas sp. NIBR10]WGM48400.1 hypothetical protein KOAAANKH_03298 [Brevundimonas sp. NIBR10]
MDSGIHAAGLWAALNIIVLLVLSGITSARRRKHRVSLGDGGKPPVEAASRAFGNAAEYMPLAIATLILLALTGHQTWVVHLIGGSFLLGRILHAWGMLTGVGPTPGRMFGMLLTYVPLLASAVMLICCWVGGL